MAEFLGYIIENPARVSVTLASLIMALTVSSLRGIRAVTLSLLAILGSFLAMLL